MHRKTAIWYLIKLNVGYVPKKRREKGDRWIPLLKANRWVSLCVQKLSYYAKGKMYSFNEIKNNKKYIFFTINNPFLSSDVHPDIWQHGFNVKLTCSLINLFSFVIYAWKYICEVESPESFFQERITIFKWLCTSSYNLFPLIISVLTDRQPTN